MPKRQVKWVNKFFMQSNLRTISHFITTRQLNRIGARRSKHQRQIYEGFLRAREALPIPNELDDTSTPQEIITKLETIKSSVSKFVPFIPALKAYLTKLCETMKGGHEAWKWNCLRHHLNITLQSQNLLVKNGKKDGTHRVILNLKDFNNCATYHHLKMDSLNTIVKLIDWNCFMATIDLKDAYYIL